MEMSRREHDKIERAMAMMMPFICSFPNRQGQRSGARSFQQGFFQQGRRPRPRTDGGDDESGQGSVTCQVARVCVKRERRVHGDPSSMTKLCSRGG
jgi:hypothetical protein